MGSDLALHGMSWGPHASWQCPVNLNKHEQHSTCSWAAGCGNLQCKVLGASKGLIIERHNSAARLILKEFRKGNLGALDTYADVGEASKVDGLELLGTRVPESILDDSELPEGPQQRDKLRPDILIVGDTATAGPAIGPRRGGRKRNAVGRSTGPITIMEVGYGSDTRYHAKLAEKNEQHAQLRSLLTAQGRKITYLPVILGTMGCTYHSTATALQRVGISHTSTQGPSETLEHACSE